MQYQTNKSKTKVESSIDSVDIPLYPGYFTLILSDDVLFVDDFCEGERVVDTGVIFGETFTIYNHKSKERHFGVCLNFNHNYKITHGVIGHEAYHIVNLLTQFIGAKIDTDNDETEALLIEWIVDTIYNFLEKRKITI